MAKNASFNAERRVDAGCRVSDVAKDRRVIDLQFVHRQSRRVSQSPFWSSGMARANLHIHGFKGSTEAPFVVMQRRSVASEARRYVLGVMRLDAEMTPCQGSNGVRSDPFARSVLYYNTHLARR